MADAQYVIDIAAGMTGATQTTAQLDALTANLMGAGKGADFFQQAIAQVSSELADAKVQTKLANDALSEGNTRYAELEKAAIKAALAAEKAGQKNGGVVPAEMLARVTQASSELEAFNSTLKGLEADAKKADDAEKHLAATLGNLRTLSSHTDKTIAAQAESTEKLRGALASVPGPLGRIGSSLLAPVQGFQKLSGEMGASNAAALLGATAFAGVAVALVALAAAAAAAVVSIAAWAIGLADTRRNADLATEAMQAMHPELIALRSTIASVAAETGMHADELQELAGRLQEAKVSARDLPAALRAAALAETALGKGGSADFIADLKAGKVAAHTLAAEVNEKLSPIVSRQMLGLSAQAQRFHDVIGGLFGGLNIEPALTGLRTLIDLFDQNTVAGQTIKFLFESVFQPLIDQAQNAAYVIEAFALGFLIGLTKVYIAVKPALRAVSEFFGFKDSSLTDTLDIAKRAGELIVPVFLVFVGVLGAIGLAVGAVIAQFVLIQGVIYAVIAAVVYLGVQLVSGLVSAFTAVKDYLAGLIGNFHDLGSGLIQGLVNGITGGAAAVVQSVVGLASSAIDAAKAKLGIHSPSTEFAAIGGNTVAGFVGAIEGGHADAQASMAALVTPPNVQSPLAMQAGFGGGGASGSSPSANGGADAASGGHGGASVVIQGNVTFQGVPDAKTGVVRFGEWLLEVLEGDATAGGAATVGGT